MASLDPRLQFHILTFIPSFSNICKKVKQCSHVQKGCLNHLMVVEILRTGLGTLWSHCLTTVKSCCTLPSKLQPKDHDIAVAHPYINCWRMAQTSSFLLAALRCGTRAPNFQSAFEMDEIAVVEVFFYYQVVWLKVTGQDHIAHIKLPLMCHVHGDSEIELPFCQLVVEEVIPCLNRWKRDPKEYPTHFNIYNVQQAEFVPIGSIDEPICIPLPLWHVILVKYKCIYGTMWPLYWAKGIHPSGALGGILADMYPHPSIWPVAFDFPRTHINTLSVVRVEGNHWPHIFTPLDGHLDCTVERMNVQEDEVSDVDSDADWDVEDWDGETVTEEI
ncbi:uncharacterized protein B0H18DRAFT_955909 [Fomitopsis serialis]|uniref:uncharacterized protein n=1 Tax=Fomitopsis serialis TaxID=139415 RepID=UPI0020072BE0|nr:uncharacterized protein B0H18DRAFT_955909 [Neoantrodia serialis]KAH9923371.1 hypothetical protein B0H18DRAFT_955909 [Neoantrodia serialis]